MIERQKDKYLEYKGKSAKIWKFLSYDHSSGRSLYYYRLVELEEFVRSNYHKEVDYVLDKLESKKFYVEKNGTKILIDQYDFMGAYLQYLNNKKKRDGKKLAAATINGFIDTAKTFITTETEIAFKTMKYNNKVKPPKIIKNIKIPLGRETILKLINGCTQPNQARLKIIIMLLSACCSRIGESLLLRISDLHLDGLPQFGTQPPFCPYIHFRGETTKTGQDRITLLTDEMAKQLELWIKGKYNVRNRVTRDENGEYKTVEHKPEMKPNDFLFLNIDSNYDRNDAHAFIYNHIIQQFHKLLNDVGLTQRSSNGQYAITPHKIRMGVRTAISPLVTDMWFPDYFMGHDVNTYYNPSAEQYKAQFKLCQSALTYLDQTAIIKHHEELKERMDNIEEKEIIPLTERLAQMEKELSEMQQMVTNKVYLKSFLNGYLETSEEMAVKLEKIYDDAKKINNDAAKKPENIIS